MASSSHIVIFPFMSKGHTIPLLHLSHLFLDRGIAVTLITTKANRSFIADHFHTSDHHSNIDVNIIELPFPAEVEEIPQGIESTDKLPSMSLFPPFASATKLMQPHFEETLTKLSSVTAIVSDMFLSWTLDSANKFGIPRLCFHGMNNYSGAIGQQVSLNRLLCGPESDDDLITVTEFPWIKITRNDYEQSLKQRLQSGPLMDLLNEWSIATAKSYGLISNTFYELESLFVDYLNRDPKPKVWCVGPLCLAKPPTKVVDPGVHQPKWIKWLDQKLGQECSVLYIAFGSQAEISRLQLEEISKGLEESQVNFLWVVKKNDDDESTSVIMKDLEERVGERGLIVREWVDQIEILKHKSVKGFVSHCGWNSVLESICWKVPILAWPMMYDQHLNTRMVVEEIKMGLRVETCDGSVRGFVKAEGLKKMVKELMEGENGIQVRNKVEEIGEDAKKAMAEGGSSWRSLNELIDELQSVANFNGGRLAADSKGDSDQRSKEEAYISVDDLPLIKI